MRYLLLLLLIAGCKEKKPMKVIENEHVYVRTLQEAIADGRKQQHYNDSLLAIQQEKIKVHDSIEGLKIIKGYYVEGKDTTKAAFNKTTGQITIYFPYMYGYYPRINWDNLHFDTSKTN